MSLGSKAFTQFEIETAESEWTPENTAICSFTNTKLNFNKAEKCKSWAVRAIKAFELNTIYIGKCVKVTSLFVLYTYCKHLQEHTVSIMDKQII